jgi:hypothetical protein
MEIPINYVAVLVAGVASMIVGFLWYSPALFGKKWAILKGYTDESLKAAQAGMGKWYGVSFVLSLLMAYMLAHVMFFSDNFFHKGLLAVGWTSALFMWLGFVMPVQVTQQIFGERKWKLFAIDTGYQLVSLLVMGLVIGLMA